MKKILFFLILCICFPLYTWAQGSVLGIKFGNSYDYVKRLLKARYGEYDVHENKGGMQVYDISVGDFTFNSGHFDFQYKGSDSYFYYAEFQKNFKPSESEKAKTFRESLRLVLGRKYNVGYIWTNGQGYKCYDFAEPGNDPKENPSCSLVIDKGESKGGDTYIYVILCYGPHHFINETSDF